MKSTLWTIFVVVSFFIGIVIGYSISSFTGYKKVGAKSQGTAGYGSPAGGHGAPAGGYGAPAGGYGAPAGGYGAPSGGKKAPAGGYGAPSGGYGR